MVKIVRSFVAMLVMASGLLGIASLPASTTYAAGCSSNFLTFPTWYAGVVDTGTCEIKQPGGGGEADVAIGNFIWRIVLNIINIALQLVGYASLGFIIYGGFRYLISSGLPDKTTAARKTILNAVIGLVLSFFSVVIVSFVAGNIS